jgi:hypothetical protein
MQKLTLSALILLSFFSCKKTDPAVTATVVGQWSWVIQRENNPAYFSTPLTTGINETMEFNINGNYAVTQNTVIVNSGTYKLTTGTSTSGSPVSGVLFSNARVTDSAAYYVIRNNNDSLMFCHDLIGTVGSSSRFYGRKP